MKTQSSTRKATQRAALRARLDAAQRDIYGNARTPWPHDIAGFESFGDWLGDYAERERDYMSVDNFGMTENETRSAEALDCKYWRKASQRLVDARRKYPEPSYATQVRDAAHVNFAFGSGDFERRYRVLILDAAVILVGSRAGRNGSQVPTPRAYSYGRQGKTFYPDAFAHENGTGFHLRDVSELNAEQATRACQFIEQFNAYTRSIANGARDVYADEAADALQEKREESRAIIRDTRGRYAVLAAELRTLRGIIAPTACDVLRGNLASLARRVRIEARALSAINATLHSLKDAHA